MLAATRHLPTIARQHRIKKQMNKFAKMAGWHWLFKSLLSYQALLPLPTECIFSFPFRVCFVLRVEHSGLWLKPSGSKKKKVKVFFLYSG
jgi:hypothetical protein